MADDAKIADEANIVIDEAAFTRGRYWMSISSTLSLEMEGRVRR
jgi:hypothetical protein